MKLKTKKRLAVGSFFPPKADPPWAEACRRASSFLPTTSYNLQTINGGYAMLVASLFFVFAGSVIVFGVASVSLRGVKATNDIPRSAEAYFVAEGGLEDALYRMKKGMAISPTETITLNGYSASTTILTASGSTTISSVGDRAGFIRKMSAKLTPGAGVVFHYGVQAGEGGIFMENSSSIAGNVFSDGPITAQSDNLIKGDAISAGPSGLIDNIHATSSAYAHTIQNSIVDKNAYYTTITNTTVSGTSYPGSADQTTASLPISDAQIAEWEATAASGGVISSHCPYEVDDDLTIGPKKINCDLDIKKDNTVVTLTGHLWVKGKITVRNRSTVKIAPSLGNQSVQIIADDLVNTTDKSSIELQNESVFQGSGSANSYILVISMNKSAETGGDKQAIIAHNSLSGAVLLYAPHGEVLLQNSIQIKEATGWKLHLKNSAQVIYESGLANLLFSAGPSGGYSISGWGEK